MPSFPNPFQGNVDRKITKEELIQAVRINIAGELEAIFLYDATAMATDDPVAKAVLEDIRDEEKVHIGELTALLRYLDPTTQTHLDAGAKEVAEAMEKLGIKVPTLKTVTVGSLKD